MPGIKLLNDKPFFKEFTITTSGNALELLNKAQLAGFDIGPVLCRFPALRAEIPGIDKALLIAVTEKRSRQEIDQLVDCLKN